MVGPKIVEAYKNMGFVSAVIFGPQGTGKTTYAFKVARDVEFAIRGLQTKDEAWKYVKFFFELPDALEYLEEITERNERIPYIIFDDASIWLSKYYWYKDYMKMFYSYYALIRSRVSAVIFTTPAPDDLAYFLREKGWYQIKIVWNNKKRKIAMAQLYEKEFARDTRGEFTTKSTHKAIDYFKVELPNDFYNNYLMKRKAKELDLLSQIRVSLSRMREENKAVPE
ncbi:zonular occludens toxin domain-containing protein [Sulfuracidifex metallicus]|uniref:zonular occludens toxin domain-containing protein n=1 Tax=Sulfuracidifex metallicus TaxID=47303 RepID=UPI0006D1B2B5|nr:zonular occludens toxin domain-containing protein [Sulfuracidifex metallicus]